MRENRRSGIVCGEAGNRHSYHDDRYYKREKMSTDSISLVAEIITGQCAGIKPKETVLVVCDDFTEACGRVIKNAATDRGATVGMMKMRPRALDGQEPTDEIAAAMKKAAVVLATVSKSLAHTVAAREAMRAGARLLSLTAISENLMASRAFRADFVRQRPICEHVARLFTQGETVRITSAAGTDLIVSAKGRKGNAHCCLVSRPGQFSSAPNIEANFSPLEGSTEGVFVADASIPYLDIGMLDCPVVFTIHNGKVEHISGGKQADIIAAIWAKQNDPAVYNIAQVAVGLNPEIEAPVGVLGCNYDEGAFGTVHIGIGTSTNLGGKVKAATHFDALMNQPLVMVDGVKILEKGQLLI